MFLTSTGVRFGKEERLSSSPVVVLNPKQTKIGSRRKQMDFIGLRKPSMARH
jgi:hypothetical protein